MEGRGRGKDDATKRTASTYAVLRRRARSRETGRNGVGGGGGGGGGPGPVAVEVTVVGTDRSRSVTVSSVGPETRRVRPRCARARLPSRGLSRHVTRPFYFFTGREVGVPVRRMRETNARRE